MRDEIVELRNKIRNLEKRLRVANREKANLAMAVNLINQVSNITGVKDIVEYILQVLVSAIGGTNISMYYEADGRWRYVDILGDKLWLDSINDELVKKAVEQKEFQKGKELEESNITIPGFHKTYETWVYPLQVQNHLFGAIRLQGMAIEHAHYRENIDPFIQYSALVLYHEISNIKSLQSAYHKVREAKDALKDAHERFLAVLNGIDATVYVADMDTHEILFINKAMKNAFGRDMTGEICYEAFRGEESPCPYCTNNKLLDENGDSTGVVVWQDKNPITRRQYINHDRAIKWTNGRMVRLQVATDITDMREMENRLQQAQKMESIGNLAGGIAHDFNNILFPIIGLSELLMEDLAPGSPEHESADQIYKAGKRGAGLVKQILAFSRQSEQQKIPIRIQHVLKEVMKLSRSSIPVNISISQNIQSDCSLVLADPTQIHQVAMNLITNAYHAVEATNGDISVVLMETSIRPDELDHGDLIPGRYALLSITDAGSGIDPAIMGNIFEPYFTTKEQGKGTGLGLAVVYGIVKEHRGDIKVNSELGKGTTFNIYLPIIEKAEASSSVEGQKELPTGHERILLIDDEEPIAKLEKQILERLGYTVTMRVNSVEALELFKAKSELFDLVISDMTMPNMTGDRLACELITIRSDIPIIICTGFSERLNQENAANIGVRGILMKPIVKEEMAKVVRDALDEAKIDSQG